MNDSPQDQLSAAERRRLPCRGCLEDCANYAICEGKPWRIGCEREAGGKAAVRKP